MAGSPRVALIAAIVLSVSLPAAAQTSKAGRISVAVSGGIQAAPGDLTDHFSFDKNLETETVDVKYPMKAGALVDVEAAYRVWKNLAFGVAVSRASGNGTARIDARVPHPFQFNQPRTVEGEESGVLHTETGVHALVQYLVPSSTRVRVALFAGPSWLTVEQEAVTDVTIAEAYPYDTAAFGGAVTKIVRASAPGFHAGVDIAWMFSRGVGVGGLIRYTRADVDLDVVEGRTIAVKAGGVQGGVGLRVVF